MHYFGAVREPGAPGASPLWSCGSRSPVWWGSASPCLWSSCSTLLRPCLTMFVKLDSELLPVLDSAGRAVKRNLEPFLPQHKKNFQKQISGLFPEALLFLLMFVHYCNPCRKKKKRQIQRIFSIDGRALSTVVGGRMEKGNTGITIPLNPAQQAGEGNLPF